MGTEAICTVIHQGRSSVGRVQLESDEIRVRGDVQLRIPLSEVQSAEAMGGAVYVLWNGDRVEFQLGSQSGRWARRIAYPPSRLEKLGVRPGHRIAIIGQHDSDFMEELADRVGEAGEIGPPTAAADIMFIRVDQVADLEALSSASAQIKQTGAVWLIRRRATVPETIARQAGLTAGLVDVKVARFSPTHVGEKFVIPRASRV